jgi:two-component system KDP operon response regulator KdpE
MTGQHVLICDPSPQLQRALRVILRGAGYRAQAVSTGAGALERARAARPMAVILELALPDTDGIDLCRELRERGQMPILVLSGIDDDRAKIAAFASGADDYMTKPFSPGELLVRLAARLRASPSPLRIEAGGLTIDLTAHLVTRDGHEIHLTATEFTLLRVLATSHGTVSHRTLVKRVWGLELRDVPSRLRAHVANLRFKLDPSDRDSVILTEPGIGYRFVGGSRSTAARR